MSSRVTQFSSLPERPPSAAITSPSMGVKIAAVATPMSPAMVAPLARATLISRHRMRRVLDRVSWFIAIARTETAIVCVPAFPPIEATIA